jgi:beta-N-acetylhexosaminidase
MFLFFNDPDEDYNTMLDAYKNGVISEERMTEALTRILGLKAKMGLNKKAKDELCPAAEELADVLANPEFKTYSGAISKDAITLVKSLDKDVLPISPEKTKRVMIVPIKGADNPLMALAMMAMGGGAPKKSPAEKLCERLVAKGFDAFIYESPVEKMKKMIAAGEKPSLNLYFAGKNSIADFVAGQDLVISLFDVAMGHPVFGLSKGGGEIPWYVHELPVIGISVNKPTMLADCPMLRTYINTYDSNDDTMDALVEALVSGEFRGKDPIDSFCGMWDTRL